MSASTQIEHPRSEVVRLVAQLRDSGESTTTDSSTATVHRPPDGPWTYQFTTDDRWGMVAGGPLGGETTYPGWGPVHLEPGQWMVFFAGDLAAVVSPSRVRIGGSATIARDEPASELEAAMVTAIRAEREALASGTESRERERNTA